MAPTNPMFTIAVVAHRKSNRPGFSFDFKKPMNIKLVPKALRLANRIGELLQMSE